MAENKYLDELTQKMLSGVQEVFQSGRIREYFKAMSKLHTYSYRNSILIFSACPNATHVAGYKTWLSLNRHVKKDEKAIRIFAPYKTTIKGPENDQSDENAKEEQKEITIIKFRAISVFDISQTEGDPLPQLAPPLQGGKDDFSNILKAAQAITNYSISFEDIPDPGTYGYCEYGAKKIVLRNGISEAQALKTLFHEMAHSWLHNLSMDKSQKEIEAEAVSFIVSEHFGLDTSSYSFDYLAAWSHGMEADKLCALLQGIQSCAKGMIERLENALQNRYEIYQLRDSPETRPYFFQGTKELKKLGLTVRQENYEKVYSSPLTPGITLDHIFEKFNINHPEDFTGHSLSVSDIVVLHENGKTTVHYVDRSGYTIIPDFVKEPEQNPKISSELLDEQNTDLSKLPYSTKFLQKVPGAMPPVKNTIIVNLFAGPGAGKTTCAWEIASELKKRNIQAEYVPEYAKELVWDEKRELLDGSLKNQRKLFQEQNHRLARLIGKVDVVVTDAPILLNQVYLKEPNPDFQKEIMDTFHSYHNFNLFVKRGDYYEQSGRLHTLEESRQKDEEVKQLLNSNRIYYGTYFHSTIQKCVDNIVYSMNHNKAFQASASLSPGAELVPPKQSSSEKAEPISPILLKQELRSISDTLTDAVNGVNKLEKAGGEHLASLVREYKEIRDKNPQALSREIQEHIAQELENYFSLKKIYGEVDLDKLYQASMDKLEALYTVMENQKNPVGADPDEYQNIKDFLSDTLTHSDDGSSLSLRLQVLLSTSPLLRETPVPAPQPDQKAELVPPFEKSKETKPDRHCKSPIQQYCQAKPSVQENMLTR